VVIHAGFLYHKDIVCILDYLFVLNIGLQTMEKVTTKPLMEPSLWATKQENFKSWSGEQVVTWLEEAGFGKYANTFRENEIDGFILATLTEDDLMKLSIPLGPARFNSFYWNFVD
jgi:hypothetical protein